MFLQGGKLPQILDEYINEYCIAEKEMAVNTVRNKRYVFGKLMKFLNGSSLDLRKVLAFRLETFIIRSSFNSILYC